MPESEKTVRRRVTYSGRVQGVGFRATTSRLAENHHVVGYVRNKSDGTVELEAEGPPTEVDQFLVDVQTEFGANISDQQRTTIEPRGKEASFEIRH